MMKTEISTKAKNLFAPPTVAEEIFACKPLTVDERLVSKALRKAETGDYRGKIVDIITIYRLSVELSKDLAGRPLQKCVMIVEEIERVLKKFANQGKLVDRKLSISTIFAS